MRHVVVMTSTGSLGLMTLFLVDLADMYFLSLLGQQELAAAIGYAGSILFLTVSICIGLSIAVGALCSRALGAGHKRRARRYAINTCLAAFILTSLVAVIAWFAIDDLLTLLGAEGRALVLAGSYTRIIIPSLPILALGMSFSGILRAAGDAKRSMYVTLSGAAVNAIFDPILIFGFDLGIEGAAIATVLARIAFFVTGFYGAVHIHHLIGRIRLNKFLSDVPAIIRIAGPSILTNIATPVGNAYITAVIAQFGDSAVAGLAIISRVMPVAFGIIFSLSGAIGPIIGQNYGARLFARVRKSFLDALIFAGLYVCAISVFLLFAQSGIIWFFNAKGDAANLIALFCTWLAISNIFNAGLFVSNAAYNNLGRPEFSTFFNWGKATLGTIPTAYFGGLWFGASGVLAGQAIGAIIFGALSTIAVLVMMQKIALKETKLTTSRMIKNTPKRGWWRNPVNKGQDL